MARAQCSRVEAGGGYIPFLTRFRSWWNGGAPPERVRKRRRAPGADEAGSGAGADPRAITVDAPSPAEAGRRWPEARVELCRRLWATDNDDEMVEPGGTAYCSDLLKPTAINSSKIAIDLSAGLGGGVRHLANRLGLWVMGMEPDAELAERAHSLSAAQGLARRAPVTAYDPDALRLPESKYHAGLMRERLYRMRDKQEVLATIQHALRPRGHLILTDFALARESSAAAKPVAAWTALEPEEPRLWTLETYQEALHGAGLEVRIFEAESQRYRRLILDGWTRLVQGLRREELTRAFVDNMMCEAEYWVGLVRALDSGELVYVRAHCMRRGPAKTG